MIGAFRVSVRRLQPGFEPRSNIITERSGSTRRTDCTDLHDHIKFMI